MQQILNRTNNIFELVTVEAVPDRLEPHNKDILGSEIEGDDHRNLRLKGIQCILYILTPFVSMLLQKHV